ncbi:MAG: citramalate synthase [Oscillospiraceae bacterium]|jgi:2-isopropylmalate synthase|nr:citramalate synthase [Oscillospiraceae bacterium]
MQKITVLDTTLRDGAQAEGISFSLEDKLSIISALDALGVDLIEAGNPAANPKDAALFARLRDGAPPKRARIVAFGATRRAGMACADDPGLQALCDCGVRAASIFGKSWDFHAAQVLRVSLDENLAMIGESIAFLASRGLTVYFDAEHFFDGYAANPRYALATLQAAKAAGAAAVILCDTNGGSLPTAVAQITAQVAAEMGGLPVGIHAHNDGGMAAANTLLAVEAGATHVQGTINGLGERCGNANLCTVLPGLRFKMGLDCLMQDAFSALSDTARYISEMCNVALDERSPYVGYSAFAHKGGMHIDGVLKNRASFEHMDPALVGNQRRLLLSEMSGRATLLTRLAAIAPDLAPDAPQVAELIAALKQKEAQGYRYEDAEGSFSLLALELLGRRPRFFEVGDFHVITQQPWNGQSAQAYIKVTVEGRQEITAAEGDGPVAALDGALRKALCVFYPQLARMRLVDFKVRVLDSLGTCSTTRVQMTSTDGQRVWGTVGVSPNIIEASWRALTDAIDFFLACREEEQPH